MTKNEEVLQLALDSINKAKEAVANKRNEEDRKFIVSQIGNDLADILKPLMAEIASNSKLNKQEIKRIIDELKIEKIEVKSPNVNVNVPDVYVPEIKIPQIKLPAINVPPARFPDTLKIAGLEESFKNIEKMANAKMTVEMSGIDRDKPLPVILTDDEGNFYKAIGEAMTTVMSGGGLRQVEVLGSNGVEDGTATVTTAGTRVQLSAALCKKVFIQSHESNTGTVVVGGANVVAALVGRRGKALYPTQGDWFNVSNLNFIWIDSTVSGDKVNYYYEV